MRDKLVPIRSSQSLQQGRARRRRSLPTPRVRERRLSQRDDPKVRAGADAPQEVGGDEQRPADCLAMLLKPRRHVHRVAKIGDLAAGIPAFADDHRARVQPARNRGAEPNS